MDGDHTGPLLERVWINRRKQNKAAYLPEDSKAEIPESEREEEKNTKKIRKELRYQLSCIRRNLRYIRKYEEVYGTGILYKIEAERLQTVKIFEGQQRYMLENKVHSVEDRIVSLSQPWIRPIVRGKSKAPTEFGAKISISVVNGYTFIDKISFDSYNENEYDEFEAVVEKYHERFGYYPERILADKIYRSRKNRGLCKKRGIKLSGPKLGKNRKEEIRQELKEIGERNTVEGKFGNGKRKLGLGLIMAKLKETTENMISMDIFVLNMEHYMRTCIVLCYTILEMLKIVHLKNKEKTVLSYETDPLFLNHYLLCLAPCPVYFFSLVQPVSTDAKVIGFLLFQFLYGKLSFPGLFLLLPFHFGDVL